jgi:phytoene/squalene synthetase
MNIIELDNCSIAYINNTNPLVASKCLAKDTAYEWFYFEITHDNSHIVIIFSLKDSFYVGKQESVPASVYLTWHKNNKLIAYSYSIFNNENCELLQSKISKFFLKQIDNLELWIPDFSLNKFIHLNLKLNFSSENNSENNYSSLNIENREHFWQFIINKNSISGTIETIHIPNSLKNSNSSYLNLSKFYDLPLKTKLSRVHAQKVQFENAHVYLDHNFGFSPLYTIKDKWCWWHSEDADKWEVTYYFPKINKTYYISSCLNSENIIDNSKIILANKLSVFLFSYPKKIYSRIFGEMVFSKIIECAPFYLRAKLKKQKISSTMEFLIPKRISSPINRYLMSARQFHVKKFFENQSFLEANLSYEEICERVTKNNGKSFFFSSLVMSKKDRNKSYLIYTICRIIDDATDNEKINSNLVSSGSSFSKIFLDTLWDNECIDPSEDFLSRLKIELSSCLSLYLTRESIINFIKNAKNEIRLLNLSKVYFEELVLGQLMDENFTQPKNFEEFYSYCFRVAGVVGLMMAKIFGVEGNAKAFQAAEHLGIAMQITNILRDISEDFKMNRVYLPKDICDKNNLLINNECFLNSNFQVNEKIKLVQELSEKSIIYYNSALSGIPHISKRRYRFCVRLMCAIYSAILSKIINNETVVFQKRVVVSKFEKFLIMLKVLIGVNPLSASGIK